ncbi:DUF1294 domain-containing protein [Bacillus suaedae]|uniref:DUF1294 domain-containing protein n=1 Tax=Halalkalibacter suaedae TaxID=2822140 RepID=A0A941AMY0_9BACI|nr:DUF1294 domain-containing protein [Bacillus suaedae]
MAWYVYVLLINVIGFSVMGIDKQRAKKGQYRISERTLFLFALIGGSIGVFTGMNLFRHKTKKRSFSLGLPMIIIAQIISVTFIILSTSA